MKVFWTDTAVDHLSALYNQIAQTSTPAAQALIDRLTRRSKQISTFPNSGRIVPEFANDRIREIIEGKYRIIYTIQSNQIEILAVLHGAQQLEEN